MIPFALSSDSSNRESWFGTSIVRRLLPHRHAMALLDAVQRYEPEPRRLVGIKCVAADEPVMQGYHPQRSIFPGSLVIEALAQACGIMMNMEYLASRGVQLEKLHDAEYLRVIPKVPLSVLAESHVSQRDAARPGDTLALDVNVKLQRNEFHYFTVRGHTDRREIAAGSILLSYPDYF